MLAPRHLALLSGAALAVAACQTAAPPPKELASDQILRLAIPSDISGVEPLDPPQIGDPLTYAIGTNIFGGLYRYDDHLRLLPDIADGSPDVSPDSRTYTFHLNPKAKFWNGDPVTAADFVYSWNRAAPAQNYSGLTFGPIDGYQAIAAAVASSQPVPMLRGVSAPDAHTLIVHLTAPSGGWLPALALPSAIVLVVAKFVFGKAPDGSGLGQARLSAYALMRFKGPPVGSISRAVCERRGFPCWTTPL